MLPTLSTHLRRLLQSLLLLPLGACLAAAQEEAATATPPAPPAAPAIIEMVPDKDWKTFTFAKDITPGSALDFSALLDAPAGKHGPVVIRNGRFEFQDRPDHPVRLFGTNLTGGTRSSTPNNIVTELTKPEADKLAARLAAMGYNAVRLHHFDHGLTLPQTDDGGAPVLDPAALDRMEYLIHALKQRGIYIVIDLYISRFAGIPAEFKSSYEVKYAAIFDPGIMANFKEHATRLLSHVNPYTGLALKDEPALATISLINENALTTNFFKIFVDNHAFVRSAFIKSWQAWCADENISPAPADPFAHPPLLTRFLVNRQIAAYETLAAHLRSLGVIHPLSDVNHNAQYVQTIMRDRFDFVDNHDYYDHPTFTGTEFASNTRNTMKDALADLGEIMLIGASRIHGRPFMLTEWNFCYPNPYRSESGPVMGAYAAFQDWSGMFRFEYSGSRLTAFGDTHTWSFNTASDPVNLLSDRIAALLFLRGDVTPAPRKITFAVTPEIVAKPFAQDYPKWSARKNAAFPATFGQLGAWTQIGSNLVTPETTTLPANAALTHEELPSLSTWQAPVIPADNDFTDTLTQAGLIDADAFKPGEGRLSSETGQIHSNATAQSFKVVTPRSEVLIQKGPEQTGDALRVSGNTTFSTVFAAAIDEQPLRSSGRILVLHLTDIRNTGERFIWKDGQLITLDVGRYPLLLRRGTAEITLQTTRETAPDIWALDPTGKRLRKIDGVILKDGAVTFTASTDMGDINALAYELSWPE